tara:strand:- start:134 stop:466 length:333 start_codon:yes stop_codon:yes gene_type:complete
MLSDEGIERLKAKLVRDGNAKLYHGQPYFVMTEWGAGWEMWAEPTPEGIDLGLTFENKTMLGQETRVPWQEGEDELNGLMWLNLVSGFRTALHAFGPRTIQSLAGNGRWQ